MKKITVYLFSLLVMSCSTKYNDIVISDTNTMTQVESAKSGIFLLKSPDALAQFSKVILFTMNVEEMVIPTSTNRKLDNTWRTIEAKQIFDIADDFDLLAKKEFPEGSRFEHTFKGGDDVLALEVRLLEFKPAVYRDGEDRSGGFGESTFETFGTVKLRVVLAHSQTGELIGVIDDFIGLSTEFAGKTFLGENTSRNQKIAWRRAFRKWLYQFRDDLETLSESS